MKGISDEKEAIMLVRASWFFIGAVSDSVLTKAVLQAFWDNIHSDKAAFEQVIQRVDVEGVKRLTRPRDVYWDEDLLRFAINDGFKDSFMAFVLPDHEECKSFYSDKELILKALSQSDCKYQGKYYSSSLVLNRVDPILIKDPQFQLQLLSSHWDKLLVIIKEQLSCSGDTYSVKPTQFEVFSNEEYREQVVGILSHCPDKELPDYLFLDTPLKSIISEAKKRHKEMALIRERRLRVSEKLQVEEVQVFRSMVVKKFSEDRLNACLSVLESSKHYLYAAALNVMEDMFQTDYTQHKITGQDLIPDYARNHDTIKRIYRIGSRARNLFEAHFPVPPASMFKGEEYLPDSVRRQKQIKLAPISTKVRSNIGAVMAIQRVYRKRQRLKKEKKNIERYFTSKRYRSMISEYSSPDEIIRDASMPYISKCKDRALSKRIVRCAKMAFIHPTIKHLTSSQAIDDILGDSVKGRQHIYTTYPHNFLGAALADFDIQNGDANVACFGFDEIDPQAHTEYEIILDLKKVCAQKPAALYKMKDLEYYKDEYHEICIGEYAFKFSSTKQLRATPPGVAGFVFKSSNQVSSYKLSIVPGASIISYNLDQIDEILALSVFRFIDSLLDDQTRELASDEIDAFYAALSKLTNEELVSFLEDVGRKISQTGEFNFYGSYRIDFDTIVSLGSPRNQYRITMDKLLAVLNVNDREVISEAFCHLPKCFLNARFCKYLIEQVENKESLAVLNGMLHKSAAYKAACCSGEGDSAQLIRKECCHMITDRVGNAGKVSQLRGGVFQDGTDAPDCSKSADSGLE